MAAIVRRVRAGPDHRGRLGGLGLGHHVIAVEVHEREPRAELLLECGNERVGDVRRVGAAGTHQCRPYSLVRHDEIASQLTPVRHHRGDADPPAAPAVRPLDQVLVELGVQFGAVHVGPRAGRLLVARLVAVEVVRRGHHVVGDVRHPAPSRPTAGSSSTSDATRSGRATASFSATAPAEGMPDHHDGAARLPASKSAERGDVGVQSPRRFPRRPAVTQQIRREDREAGQVLRRQRPPPLTVSGQPVHGQNLRRLLGAEAVHIEECVLLATASMLPGTVAGTCRTLVVSCPHVRTAPRAHVDSVDRTRRSRCVRVLGGPGTGKTHALIESRRRAYRRRRRSGIRSAADGFGAARHAGAGPITSALLQAGCRAVVREPLVRTVHSYAFAVLRLAAQRNGDPPPRLITTAEQDGIIRELLAGDLEDGDKAAGRGRAAAAGAEHRRVRHRAARPVGPLHRTRRRIPLRCNASAGSPAVRSGSPPASSPSSTSRRCCCGPRSGWPRPQATVPALGAAELVGAALEAFADGPRAARRRTRPGQAPAGRRRPDLDPQAARLVRVLGGRRRADRHRR